MDPGEEFGHDPGADSTHTYPHINIRDCVRGEGSRQSPMNTKSIQDQVRSIERSLPLLELQRASGPFANDVYEAAVHWRNLGKRAQERDTRVNYPKRAREEKILLAKLSNGLAARAKGLYREYAEVFAIAEKLLDQVEAIPASQEGHFGLLKAVKTMFSFLQANYGFQIRIEEPTCVRYSSSTVYVEFESSANPVLSCSFGPENSGGIRFWIDDLLYLYGDERYQAVRKKKPLETKDEAEEWFAYLAGILKQYGDEVLTNQPEIFERLAVAQALRDREWVATEGQRAAGPGF